MNHFILFTGRPFGREASGTDGLLQSTNTGSLHFVLISIIGSLTLLWD